MARCRPGIGHHLGRVGSIDEDADEKDGDDDDDDHHSSAHIALCSDEAAIELVVCAAC